MMNLMQWHIKVYVILLLFVVTPVVYSSNIATAIKINKLTSNATNSTIVVDSGLTFYKHHAISCSSYLVCMSPCLKLELDAEVSDFTSSPDQCDIIRSLQAKLVDHDFITANWRDQIKDSSCTVDDANLCAVNMCLSADFNKLPAHDIDSKYPLHQYRTLVSTSNDKIGKGSQSFCGVFCDLVNFTSFPQAFDDGWLCWRKASGHGNVVSVALLQLSHSLHGLCSQADTLFHDEAGFQIAPAPAEPPTPDNDESGAMDCMMFAAIVGFVLFFCYYLCRDILNSWLREICNNDEIRSLLISPIPGASDIRTASETPLSDPSIDRTSAVSLSPATFSEDLEAGPDHAYLSESSSSGSGTPISAAVRIPISKSDSILIREDPEEGSTSSAEEPLLPAGRSLAVGSRLAARLQRLFHWSEFSFSETPCSPATVPSSYATPESSISDMQRSPVTEPNSLTLYGSSSSGTLICSMVQSKAAVQFRGDPGAKSSSSSAVEHLQTGDSVTIGSGSAVNSEIPGRGDNFQHTEEKIEEDQAAMLGPGEEAVAGMPFPPTV